jgi:hypothetical protein
MLSNTFTPKYGFFKIGTVIGILVDFDQGSINFFKDGYDLGEAFRSDEIKSGELFPFI